MAETPQGEATTAARQDGGAPPSPTPSSTKASSSARDKAPIHGWCELGQWTSARPWPVVLFVSLFVIAALAWLTDACTDSPFLDKLLPLLTLVWVALLFAWFVTCFTGDAYENRTRAIEFAYFFMVLSFCLVAVTIADMGKTGKFGVVEGCIENLDSKNTSPIQCDYPLSAWRNPTAQAARVDGVSVPAATEGAKPLAGAESGRSVTDPSAAARKNGAAGGGDMALPDVASASGGATSERYGVPTYADLRVAYELNRNYHYLLNIGGRLSVLEGPNSGRQVEGKPQPAAQGRSACKPPVYAVRGGLPVPVYFIVLALIGGAISLAKNVPGIQKRSDTVWQGTAAEPRLSPGEVRELLLFQVLQFVSAPLLAVAAYHTVKPESFAAIRGMVKPGQSATGGPAPLTGSITGTVTQRGAVAANATVTLVSTTLSATTNPKGEFALMGVPVKNDPYTLRVSSGGVTEDVSVTVKDPAPVTVSVDLA